MKITWFLCVLVTVVTCEEEPDKRFVIDTFASIFKIPRLKADLQVMADKLGLEPSVQSCEIECHTVFKEESVLQFGCPLLCHSFDTFLNYYDVTTPRPPIPNPEG